MNKIDAFFTVFSLWLAWVFFIYLLPPPVMMVIYMFVAAIAVGIFIGNVPKWLSKKTKDNSMNEMFEVLERQNESMVEMIHTLRIAHAANQTLLARIDELMFEYCPEEMTEAQIANYEAHLRAVEINHVH